MMKKSIIAEVLQYDIPERGGYATILIGGIVK